MRTKEVHSCDGCRFMKMYDYGKRIYYCDNESRIDDMGKLGENELPEMCPEWCPLRGNSK